MKGGCGRHGSDGLDGLGLHAPQVRQVIVAGDGQHATILEKTQSSGPDAGGELQPRSAIVGRAQEQDRAIQTGQHQVRAVRRIGQRPHKADGLRIGAEDRSRRSGLAEVVDLHALVEGRLKGDSQHARVRREAQGRDPVLVPGALEHDLADLSAVLRIP